MKALLLSMPAFVQGFDPNTQTQPHRSRSPKIDTLLDHSDAIGAPSQYPINQIAHSLYSMRSSDYQGIRSQGFLSLHDHQGHQDPDHDNVRREPIELSFSNRNFRVDTRQVIQHYNFGYRLAAGEISVDHPFGDTGFLRNGWQSWSYNDWIKVTELEKTFQHKWQNINSDNESLFKLNKISGSGVGVLDAGSGKILLIGALGLNSIVEADTTTMVGRYEEKESDWYIGYGNEREVFKEYSQILEKALNPDGKAIDHEQRISSVWCSWYSHYTRISETTLSKDLADLQLYPFEVFQIDDGWQKSIGDWTANSKFPGGMKAMADAIRKSGKRPGIWLSPLIARADSTLFREHRNWFVKDSNGEPLKIDSQSWDGNGFYPLDITHPDVKQFVRETIERITKEWGYNYLKLDFLFAGAVIGEREESNISREEALREIFKIIREAAGEETYLLGCGTPIYPCIGLFNGVRASPDVGPTFWHSAIPSWNNNYSTPSGIKALRSTFHRLWMNDLIQVDPDVAFFNTHNNLLREEEKQILQQLAQVCGFKSSSDRIDWLSDRQKDEMLTWLSDDDKVIQLDRYRFLINDKEVNFADYLRIEKPPSYLSAILHKIVSWLQAAAGPGIC